MHASIHLDPTKRHDFALLFDVTDGNPNGDPDAGNLPRQDPLTGQGLVTDVAQKRKVRDYVDMVHGAEDRYKIYVQSGVALNTQHQRAYDALGLTSTGAKQSADDIEPARAWMCANFYDIRMFGAVMTTGVNCGQVRGPLQMTFARSQHPITPLDLTITRIAVTKETDQDIKIVEGVGKGGKQTEMGRKAIVPYALYRSHGFYNPHFAASTGVTSEDLDLFWHALQAMWDYDRSAARGMMSCRGVYIFSHDHPLGNAPAHRLFESIRINPEVSKEYPQTFHDYDVTPPSTLPEGIHLTILGG